MLFEWKGAGGVIRGDWSALTPDIHKEPRRGVIQKATSEDLPRSRVAPNATTITTLCLGVRRLPRVFLWLRVKELAHRNGFHWSSLKVRWEPCIISHYTFICESIFAESLYVLENVLDAWDTSVNKLLHIPALRECAVETDNANKDNKQLKQRVRRLMEPGNEEKRIGAIYSRFLLYFASGSSV